MWIPYLALPLGLGLFVMQMIADLIAAWRCDAEVLGHGEFEEDY
jgi:TRAP-type C4-dicarboxylate transport system permease small subunit